MLIVDSAVLGVVVVVVFVLVHEMASCSLASCHRRKRHSKKQKHCARSYIYRRANNSFALELQARAKWRTTTTTTKSKRRQTSEQVLCFCLFHTGGTAERAISAYTNCCRGPAMARGRTHLATTIAYSQSPRIYTLSTAAAASVTKPLSRQ